MLIFLNPSHIYYSFSLILATSQIITNGNWHNLDLWSLTDRLVRRECDLRSHSHLCHLIRDHLIILRTY